MPLGPGRYDDLCSHVRELAEADGVVLIVFGGTRGNGMSCQCDVEKLSRLPEVLEQVAADIRASFAEGQV